MSQMPSNTLCFTHEQGNEIIVQDSLFGENSNPDAAPAQLAIHDYRKLLEKDKRLELHAITLSDYWREEIIPRGLRMKKFPTFGKDDADFRRRWEAILNKCSLDLILLLIEEIKKQRMDVRKQVEEVQPNIESAALQDPSFAETLQKTRDEIDSLSKALKQNKMEKFKRDRTDYQQGTVYLWPPLGRPNSNYKRRGRNVSFSLPSSTSASEGEEPIPTTSGQHFLDGGRKTPGPRRRGGRRDAAEGGGQAPNYQLRPRQTHPAATRKL